MFLSDCRRRCFQDMPYEYVLVDSPRLASVSADGGAFAEYIAAGEGDDSGPISLKVLFMFSGAIYLKKRGCLFLLLQAAPSDCS